MKKKVNKFTKLLLLVTMIIYDLMTPITVLADALNGTAEPNKGDLGTNNTISNDGKSATVSVGSLDKEGDVQVTKTVSKTDTEGRYKIDFEIKGKDANTSTQVTKDVYVVVVLDKSGSMSDSTNKWSNAVSGAKAFAKAINDKNKNAHIGLVEFSGNTTECFLLICDYDKAYNDVDIKRGLGEDSKANFDSIDFGSPDGGTNLQGGLYEAKKMLNNVNDPNAQKYVVVIGDGAPTFYYDSTGYTQGDGGDTEKDVLKATLDEAESLKNIAEIYSIGYALPPGNVYSGSAVYGKTTYTAREVLQKISSNGTTNYFDADVSSITGANSPLNGIVNEISSKSAGTNATLTDNIGSAFKIVDKDGNAYVSENIPEITEEGTKLSFYVDIDKDSVTGWHNTNSGFNLKYTDATGKEVTLSCDENPQVYWVQNEYDYKVNYYKDSFNTNPIASDTRKAVNGTVINVDNVEKDKYLDNSDLGTVGYEFNSIDPESIIVTNDGNTKTINVLYTIKSFDYVVNYYYSDINNNYSSTPDGSIPKNNINYGTVVNASDYYLEDTAIREGYKLDTVKSDNSTYTITDNGVVIDIYYMRDNYDYTIKYYFDNNIDTDFTNNKDGIYGTIIYARDNYLDDDKISTKDSEDNKDYFLDPNNSNNTSNITIGTNENNNILNIYYISTYVTDEDIKKDSSVDKITSSNDKITYTVNYNSIINNLRKGQKVTVVVTDTLPYAIDEDKSDLNDGAYNSDTKTITWTFEEIADKFYTEYNVNKNINYTVVYKDFANVSSEENNTISNSVKGTTTTGGKTTVGATAEEKTTVEINGNLIVHHYEKGTTNSLYSDEKTTNLVGANYTTNYRTNILGYTVDQDSMPINKDGKYTEGTTEVTYYYVKNTGKIENPDVEKIGPNTINSVDGIFDYTIKATGSVKEYVGTVKVTVTDNLPYKLDTKKSVIDDRCTYDDNKTLTCTVDYDTIDKEDYTNDEFVINETFNLKLVFVGIDSDKVVNKATSVIKLDTTEKTTNDEEETIVDNGKVTAIYVEKDNESNVLAEEESSTVLVGTNYATDSKEVFGYTLTEEPSNKTGKYTKEDITVKYLYTKNDGTIDTPIVVKEGPKYVTSVDSIFNYTLSVDSKITDYVGAATLKVVDTLPYEVDKTKSTIDKRCIYTGDKEITCKVEYKNITEEDYTNGEYIIDEDFNLSLVFMNIDSDKVTNSMNAVIVLNKTTKDNSTETTSEIEKGKVTAIYVEKDNETNVLASEEVTTDLVGKDYTTDSKEVFGYTLTEEPDNKTGKYTKEYITVKYLYTKNAGEIENPDVEKTGPNTINSVDGKFDYTIKATGSVKDYVGTVKVTITDTLPYKLDTEKLVIDNRCNYDGNKTLTCTVDYGTIDKEDYTDGEFVIDETFNLTLVYIDIDSGSVTNKATSVIKLDTTEVTSDDEFTSEVKQGNVVVNYVTTDGTKLTDSITMTGLVGTEYETLKLDFAKYYLVEVKGNQNGLYTDEITEVTYVYDLIPLPPQTGMESEEPKTTSYVMYILTMLMLLALGFKVTQND